MQNIYFEYFRPAALSKLIKSEKKYYKEMMFDKAEHFFVRYPHLTERDVAPVDYVWKTFEVPHIYNFRGLYNIMINGFDERSYAEETHHITVFKMPCKVPKVNNGILIGYQP